MKNIFFHKWIHKWQINLSHTDIWVTSMKFSIKNITEKNRIMLWSWSEDRTQNKINLNYFNTLVGKSTHVKRFPPSCYFCPDLSLLKIVEIPPHCSSDSSTAERTWSECKDMKGEQGFLQFLRPSNCLPGSMLGLLSLMGEEDFFFPFNFLLTFINRLSELIQRTCETHKKEQVNNAVLFLSEEEEEAQEN